MKLTMATLITVAVLLTIGIGSAQPVPAPPSSTTRQVTTQTPDEDLWLAEMSFERAATTKQHDTAQRMFHTDFVGVDADGSPPSQSSAINNLPTVVAATAGRNRTGRDDDRRVSA